MDEGPLDADRIGEHLDANRPDAVRAALGRLDDAPGERRKETLRALRDRVDERTSALGAVIPAVTPFLRDDDRSVRLTTAKLVVAVAEVDPTAAVPAVEPLADRLRDDEEFYFVRARAAEALGYVALERADAVATPDVLADLTVGLAFDDSAVRERLAKALAFVALGDPDRLRHQVTDVAEHLDDDADLVRYYLCTALVVVGSAHPRTLPSVSDRLTRRLCDRSPFVRGRAAEALGVASSVDDDPLPRDPLGSLANDAESFTAARARFALAVDEPADSEPLGTVESVRETVESVAEAVTAPEADGECPHCGLELPGDGPPMCPRCGTPH